jgi:hypothetical protein
MQMVMITFGACNTVMIVWEAPDIPADRPSVVRLFLKNGWKN